jgi:hypothetical protein
MECFLDRRDVVYDVLQHQAADACFYRIVKDSPHCTTTLDPLEASCLPGPTWSVSTGGNERWN